MSKFDKVFEARETPTREKSSTTVVQTKSAAETVRLRASETIDERQTNHTSKSLKQRGRPKAKRSDPDFVGFTTYIRKDTHLKVKIALLQEAGGRELSELVEELFIEWLKRH